MKERLDVSRPAAPSGGRSEGTGGGRGVVSGRVIFRVAAAAAFVAFGGVMILARFSGHDFRSAVARGGVGAAAGFAVTAVAMLIGSGFLEQVFAGRREAGSGR